LTKREEVIVCPEKSEAETGRIAKAKPGGVKETAREMVFAPLILSERLAR